MAAHVERVGYCQVCGEGGARYRCPRCVLVTCSVNCVKQHKVDNQCSGVRDKTAFVKRNEFTDLHLLSDYRFMEDAGRCIDTAERSIPHYRFLPYWTNQLLRQCKSRRINLQLMPFKFTKRSRNTSKYIHRLQKIAWLIEWKFADTDSTFVDKSVFEDVFLRDALLNFINQTACSSEAKQCFKIYKSAGFDNISVLMKLENRPANSPLFTQLNLDKSICDNLRDKLIIEYPTLIVIFKENISKYPLDNTITIQNDDKVITASNNLEDGEIECDENIVDTKQTDEKVVTTSNQLEDGEIECDENIVDIKQNEKNDYNIK